jgi:hypothetical protein
MNTNAAAYWIAVGVLALGLSSEYQHGRFETLHRIAEHANLALDQVSAHAEQALVATRLLTTRDASGVDRLMASTDAAEMALDRSEMVREQALETMELLRDRGREGVAGGIREQIRAQAEIRRAEIDEIRSRTRSEARSARMVNRRALLVCPRTAAARVIVNTGLHSVDVSADEDEN